MPASARTDQFFLNQNLLGVAQAMAIVRADVVDPGHARLPEVPPGAFDQDWLPIVGAKGLVVITRGKRIRTRPVEIATLIGAGVRTFVLASGGNLNTWDTLSLLCHWDQIERDLVDSPSAPGSGH